jgi:MFS family permease
LNPSFDPSSEGDLPTPAASGADPYAVLRNRDLLLYLIGRFVSSFGQQMVTVAVGWELYERTHRPLDLGLIGLTQMLPMVLFTLPAGHVADNYNRKRIIVLMTLAAACASLGLTLISVLRADVFWMYFCLFAAGTARTFVWPASSAFLPQLVSRKEFSRAVTWSSGSFQLSAAVGPAVGGGLIALLRHAGLVSPAAPVYALNAALAFVCLVLIRFVRQHQTTPAREKMTARSLGAGFKFVFNSPVILGTITLDLFAVLLGGATALLPVYAKEILRVGPTGLGFLQAALPLGSLLCALILAHRPPLERAGRTMLWAVTIFGLATIGFGLSQWFSLSLFMLFVCGAVDNISVVVRHTLVQLLTPEEKRGRVSAVNSLFIGTSNELGGFESGFVAQWLGPGIGNAISTGAILSVVTGGIGTVLVVLAVAAIWPQIPKYGRLDGG